MFWILVLYAGFASVFTFGKVALTVAYPIFLVGSRMAIAGGLMLIYCAYRTPRSLRLNASQMLGLGLLAFFNIYLTNVLEFWALKHLTTLKTCFFYSLSPFIAALLSLVFLGERLSRQQWIGLLIGFVGFWPMLLNDSWTDEAAAALGWQGWAEIGMLVAVAASAYGWIVLKQTVKHQSVSPLLANGVSMFIGGLIALAHSWLVEPWQPLPIMDLSAFLYLSATLILVSNFFCYNLYGYLLKRFSATFLSFAGFVTPFFTACYGYIFLEEAVPLTFYIAISVVSLGLFLFYQEELKQGVAAQPALAAN